MEIKNFLYLLKKIRVVFLCSFLLACQNLSLRNTHDSISPSTQSNSTQKSTEELDKKADQPSSNVEKNPVQSSEAPIQTPPATPVRNNYKFGIILGPGGARSFAHISALQEIQRLKIPLRGIVGMEFSALPAAVFAQNYSGNDVEWQMNKLREEEFKKNGLFKKTGFTLEPDVLRDFLSSTVGKMKVEQGKIPFACPSVNIKKNQTFMMSRGNLEQLLPFCMSYPPYFAPYQGSIAGTRDVKSSIDWLKKQGANYIVYINILGSPGYDFTVDHNSIESILWAEIALATVRPSGVDAILTLTLDGFTIDNFSDKREIFQKTSDMTIKQVNNWARQFGF